ncbi:MAG: 2-oxoacid:ferredoxin oxidoreductase subunit gamma [Thermoanaerobacterales bacterium]|jgi:2-oxoglutarate ferredoxin oxidoreductase subunit gamma|nr:2-oxoacid:ferredoxin oxidoreductase subunit gamma [Thermoanaerobacterales bacterium]
MKTEILIAGFGGQGIMLLGEILAYSAMKEGKEVSWIPSYGPEMRGGTANCMVVISDKRIPSPIVTSPDLFIAMNKPSLEKFLPRVKPSGTVFLNKSMIDYRPSRTDVKIECIDAVGVADKLGNIKTANMVVLGAVVRTTQIVRQDTVLTSLNHFMEGKKKRLLDINRKAFMSTASRDFVVPVS